MIGEIVPSNYDIYGKPVPVSSLQRELFFRPSYPMLRYVAAPLHYQCASLVELRRFLRTCRYVPDPRQFRQKDYWLPPDVFEHVRKGDCDEFALWTWRQMIGMGYQARFVIGRAGRDGEGHAWVSVQSRDKHYIVEPLAWRWGGRIPRLHFIRYEPKGSVEWDGKSLHYFLHEKPKKGISPLLSLLLVGEWLLFWLKSLTGILLLEDVIQEWIIAGSKQRRANP